MLKRDESTDLLHEPSEWIRRAEQYAEDQWRLEHDEPTRDDLPESDILLDVLVNRGDLGHVSTMDGGPMFRNVFVETYRYVRCIEERTFDHE